MGYRPRSRPDSPQRLRQDEIKELNSQRANYVFLLNEMNPTPGDPVDTSFREAIAEVDARLAELNPPPPRGPSGVAPARLPRLNPRTLKKGYLA